MNRVKLMSAYFNFCTENNLKPNEVVLSAGGALVMLGLRRETSDLDVDVPDKIYDKFLRKSKVEERGSSHGTYLDVTEDISIHRAPKGINPIRIHAVWIYPIDKLIEQKTKLSIAHDRPQVKAEQDLLDITNLQIKSLDFIALS